MPYGHGVAQGTRGDSSAVDGETGPPHSRTLLETGQDVESRAERIGVDEQGVASFVIPRGPGQCGGEGRRARSPASSDDREDSTGTGRGLVGGCDDREQFNLLGREGEDVFGADGRGGCQSARPAVPLHTRITPGGGMIRPRTPLLRTRRGRRSPRRSTPCGHRHGHLVQRAIGRRDHATEVGDQRRIVDQSEDVVHARQAAPLRVVSAGGTASEAPPVDESGACGQPGRAHPRRTCAQVGGCRRQYEDVWERPSHKATALARGEEARAVCVQPRGRAEHNPSIDPAFAIVHR